MIFSIGNSEGILNYNHTTACSHSWRSCLDEGTLKKRHNYSTILNSSVIIEPLSSGIKQRYLGVWAKVKRRCSAILRFIRSLRNSNGEWRGELRGEPQGDILGDMQGEQDVCGFSWKAGGLQPGKEPASPAVCRGGSLMVLFPTAFWVQRHSPVSPTEHSGCLSEEIHKQIFTVLYPLVSSIGISFFLILRGQIRMYPDAGFRGSAGKWPSLCSGLCLHSTELWLNMARLEL